MGFLSGVLSNIQDHLGQHKNTLDSAIEALKKNKHLGKKGFNDAIEKVAAGVRGYNEKVREGNEKIGLVITTLSGQMKSYSKDALREILPRKNELGKPLVHRSEKIQEAVEAVDNIRVTECKKLISKFFSDMLKADKDIKDLNPELQIQIENAKSVVKEHAAWLSSIHKQQKKDKDAVIEKVEKQLEDSRDQIKERIRGDINKLLDDLIRRVRSILRLLNSIETNVQQYVNDLDLWIMEADAVVREAGSKVDRILEEVDNPAKCKEEVKAAAEYIKRQGLTLHEKFTELKNKYNDVFTIIKGKEGDGGDDTCVVKKLSDAQTKVNEPEDLETWRDDNGNWGVSNSVDALIRQIKENVSNYLDTLNDALAAGVAEQKGNAVNAGSTPALDAVVAKLGDTELGDKSGALGGLLETAKEDKGDGGLGNNLEKVLKHLYAANEGWNAREPISDIYRTLKASMQETITAVNGELGQLLQAAAIRGAANLHNVVAGIVGAHLATIETLNGEIERTAQEAQSMIDNKAEEVKRNLHQLCAIVQIYAEAGKDSAKGKLLELKNKIGKTTKGTLAEGVLRKIHNDIDAILKGDLKDSIRETTAFLSHAEQVKENTIQVLQHLVTTKIDGARDTIADDIKTRYVQFIKAQLTAFADKVTTAIAPLPKEITADADKGVKGFMRVLQDELGDSGLPSLLVATAKLEDFSSKVKTFFTELPRTLNTKPDIMPLTYLSKLSNAFKTLFTSLAKYDSKFVTNLDALNTLLTEMHPESYAHQNNPLLQILQGAITDMHGELDKAYISVYDGASNINWDQANNPQTTYCAKILLTLLQMLFDGLHELRKNCTRNAAWEHKTISLTEAGPHGNTITNTLGRFFQRCGYTVCSGPNKHNGELRNTAECRGGHIHRKLEEGIRGKDGEKYKLVTEVDLEDAVLHRQPRTDDTAIAKQYGILKQLVNHLHHYYRVTHLPHFAARKYPCSVFDMLKWLCGLTSSTVYNDLTLNGFDVLFEKDEKETESEATTGDIPIIDEKPASLSAYPYDITAAKLGGELSEVCHYSQDVLTCLLGNGHADGIYACEFNATYDGFMYPSNMDTLSCMLREILNRVYLQLHFLLQQCQYGTSLSGWLECEYGKDVGGSSWRCNTNQCADQNCRQIADQKKNQNCKLHPKCGVKSPLQSFLEDGLQGFLPHQIRYEKGKLECNVKAHSGIQCVTPMGFADISHVASVTQTGQRIADVLAGFCGNQMSPLAKMCSPLNCAILSAPKTLGEMFAFYYGFLENWNVAGASRTHKRDAFEKAVVGANFGDINTALDVVSIQCSSDHDNAGLNNLSEPVSTHLKGDMFGLVRCKGTKGPVYPCGPYLQSLESHVRSTCSEKHAGNYLSWVVYLTETFYILLKKLYDECDARCGGEKPKCRISKCGDACNTKQYPGAHGVNHVASCRSIVQCPTTHPTLYKYGFTFGSPNDLGGLSDVAKQRTCYDFCTALKIVVKEGNLLFNLANKHIPAYLFTIRQPFIWLTVALWSLSLFYLICVMDGRLDVLHIRSHLRIPSSHKITAQSLLAAAQVGRLAKISYLQP